MYFARNLINERLSAIKEQLPFGIEPEMGPIATGLGEIYMYSITADESAKQNNGRAKDALAFRANV